MKNRTVSVKPFFLILATFSLLLVQPFASAQINLSGGIYTQNFNSLGTTSGISWADNTLIPGWYAAKASVGPVTTVLTGAGAANTGAIYNFGTTNDTDRALGSVSSGTPITFAYGVRLVNDTAFGQTDFTISYTGEQWRNGGNTAIQPLAFSYRVDNTEITDPDANNNASWIAFPALTFNSPTVGSTATALNGNDPTNRTTFSNIVLSGVTLLPGQELFLRWVDINDAGNDHGLALDDLTISFTQTNATVTPPTITTQPTNQTAFVGQTVQFTVAASGTSPFTYQWFFGNDPVGINDSTLTLDFITTNEAGNYHVVVQNSGGSATSQVAVLTVQVPVPVVTNIAYLRTQQDTVNYAPTNTTTLYTVEGIVTTPVNLTTPTNAQFYMQDGNHGIAVFVSGSSLIRPAEGDRVRVTGPLGIFNGLLELNMDVRNVSHSVEALTSGHPLPIPAFFQFATLTDLPTMEGIVEGSVVVVSNVFLQNAGSNFTANTTVNMTNLLGEVSVIRIDSRILTFGWDPIPTFAASITGVMGQFDTAAPFTSGYQLFLTRSTDIVAGTPPPPSTPLNVNRDGNNIVLTWSDPAFELQAAPIVSGTYTNIPGATSPHTNSIGGSQQYFRLISNP